MSKFTFKFEEQTVDTGNKSTTIEFNAISLNTILNEFTDFLKGCGYRIDGYVDIVNPEGTPSTINALKNSEINVTSALRFFDFSTLMLDWWTR